VRAGSGRRWNPIDLGQPGASAQAEYQRRRRRDGVRREAVFGRVLAPLVNVLRGERASTVAWARGGDGEARVGTYLTEVVGARGIVLHDRRIARSRGNIDHIAVVPTGIWVIDTKRYRARIGVRHPMGWFITRPSLVVNGRTRTDLVAGVQRQRQLVQAAAGPGVDVRPVLCFVDARWNWPARPFQVDGVTVTWPTPLARTLRGRGALSRREVEALARRIARAFPAYAPSGTSQSPTGAWPNR
jgi:Nuclease-related domain